MDLSYCYARVIYIYIYTHTHTHTYTHRILDKKNTEKTEPILITATNLKESFMGERRTCAAIIFLTINVPLVL